jgi:hypothetical protein
MPEPLDIIAGDNDSLEFEAGAALELADIEAAEADGTPKTPTFTMLAYTGGAMRVARFTLPIVVDLAGMKVGGKQVPIFRDHDSTQIVGHGEVEITANDIRVNGLISADNEHSRDVVTSSKKGFPWQSSIGAGIALMETVKKGEKVIVNGKTHVGPVIVARETVLNEVSVVPLGADRRTSTKVAAQSVTLSRLNRTKPGDSKSVTLAALHSRRKS